MSEVSTQLLIFQDISSNAPCILASLCVSIMSPVSSFYIFDISLLRLSQKTPTKERLIYPEHTSTAALDDHNVFFTSGCHPALPLEGHSPPRKKNKKKCFESVGLRDIKSGRVLASYTLTWV